MAYGFGRKRRRRKKSKPSMITQVTKPFRAIPKAVGITSPVQQTLIATPFILAAMYVWMPDLYDRVTELPETIGDAVQDKLGGM